MYSVFCWRLLLQQSDPCERHEDVGRAHAGQCEGPRRRAAAALAAAVSARGVQGAGRRVAVVTSRGAQPQRSLTWYADLMAWHVEPSSEAEEPAPEAVARRPAARSER